MKSSLGWADALNLSFGDSAGTHNTIGKVPSRDQSVALPLNSQQAGTSTEQNAL